MVAKFRFTNEIPKNLTPGVYTTKVISANHTDTGYLIELEFIGEEYNAGNPQCLFPMTKTDLDTD